MLRFFGLDPHKLPVTQSVPRGVGRHASPGIVDSVRGPPPACTQWFDWFYTCRSNPRETRPSMITSTRTVDPRALAPAEREAFVDQLVSIQAEVFDGVTRGQLQKYVVDSPAQVTEIEL